MRLATATCGLAATGSFLSGCAGFVNPLAKTQIIVDDVGRAVEIPAPNHLTNVYYTSPLAQIFCLTMAPDLMAGSCVAYDADQLQFLPQGTERLDVMGSLSSGGVIDISALKYNDVQIVFSISGTDLTDVNINDALALQEETGIPVVLIDGSFDRIGDTYRLLGTCLGRAERAEELARYCESIYERVTTAVSAVPNDELVTYYFAEGQKDLQSELPLVQKSVTPEADGSWSLDLDLTLPSPQENDIWTIVAECVSYDNVTQQAVSFPLIFDSTPFNGTFTIEGEPGAQNFRIEATGLTPGETATINLVSATDPTVTYLVGTVVVDANGSVNAVFAAPNVPDGTYYLEIFGDHHGEGGQSADRIKVSNGVYSIDDGNNNIVPPTTDPADPTAAPSAAPTATAQPALAKTGVNGTTLALAALGLTGLGAAAAFVASRRKA